MPRRLSPEESALWGQVARSVRPLGGKDVSSAPSFAPPERSRGTASSEAEKKLERLPDVSASLDVPPRLRSGRAELSQKFRHTLDASWDKRLAKGVVHPDCTIDLHGETLTSAHTKLTFRLDAAIRQGARIVLLITGRPAHDNPRLPPTSRGVIRASVMDWLMAGPHGGWIAAIRNAHPRHGGAGALYLILRRPR